MFDDDFEEYEDDEMTPEEESFPAETYSGGNSAPRNSLADKVKQNAMNKGGSSKDGKKLQDTIAKNKGKNGAAGAAKNAMKNGNNGSQGKEDENGEEKKTNPAEDAAKQAAIELAKQAASKALQAYGVPEPVTKEILDKATETEEFQKLVDKTIEKFKKQKRKIILQIIMAIAPYVLGLFVAAFICAAVMMQYYAIVDKVDSAVTYIATVGEKILNFSSGNGWNTNEEAFFKNLKSEYEFSKGYSINTDDLDVDRALDIALLASTLHYNYLGDVSVYEDDQSGPTVESTESDDPGMFDGFLEQQELKNFYYVAADKLGAIGDLAPGQRKLIGHLYDVQVTMEKYTFTEAYNAWANYFRYYGKVMEETLFQDIFKSLNPASWLQHLDTLLAYELTGNENDSYYQYQLRNIEYEISEINKNHNDMLKKDENGNIDSAQLTDTTTEEEKGTGNWLAPTVKFVYNEDKYYDYLVNVYIPGTYFSGVEYDQAEVESIAREIFQQRDMFNYLFEVDYLSEKEEEGQGCSYNYGSASDINVKITDYNIDSNFIDNLMVEVYNGKCGSKLSQCSNSDITHTISFEDYVIGVAYSEIGASLGDNEEWVKANMVAIKSYALGKNPGSLRKDGDKFYLSMLNNTYQQTFCDTVNGCLERETNRKPALTEEAINFLKNLYRSVKNEFLYSESSGFVGSYRSDYSMCVSAGITGMCLGQNDSEQDAENGLNYQNILGKYYTVDVGLFDVSTSSLKASVYQCYSAGLVAGNYGDYFIRGKAPVSSDVYYNVPYVSNSNRGQCVWYVKGRASEIVGTSVTDKEVQDKLLSVLKNATGNGNQWYNEALQSVFGSSTDYTKPKRGSIAVYDWNDQRCLSYWNRYGSNYCKARYGHAIIIEEVNEENQTVTITDGWTNTGSCPNNWDCVQFRSRSDIPISDLNNLNTLGGGFKFIGYIYLLD